MRFRRAGCLRLAPRTGRRARALRRPPLPGRRPGLDGCAGPASHPPRRRNKRMTRRITLIGVVLVALALPAPAGAREHRHTCRSAHHRCVVHHARRAPRRQTPSERPSPQASQTPTKTTAAAPTPAPPPASRVTVPKQYAEPEEAESIEASVPAEETPAELACLESNRAWEVLEDEEGPPMCVSNEA
jgi:hypothetical protein